MSETAVMPIDTWVVDASVAVKWLLEDEDLVTEARAVRSSVQGRAVALGAPDIIWAEVGHALVRAVRRGRLGESRAQTLAGEIFDLKPLISDLSVDPRDAVRVALIVGVSAYDAHYLALGSTLGTPVLTADGAMFDKGRAHGFEVVWLGDLSGRAADTPQGYR